MNSVEISFVIPKTANGDDIKIFYMCRCQCSELCQRALFIVLPRVYNFLHKQYFVQFNLILFQIDQILVIWRNGMKNSCRNFVISKTANDDNRNYIITLFGEPRVNVLSYANVSLPCVLFVAFHVKIS